MSVVKALVVCVCVYTVLVSRTIVLYYYCTHAHMHNQFMALWILSGATQVSRYQKKCSPTHTYCGHQSSLSCFLYLLPSMASSLFNLSTWQTFSKISLQVFFGLPLGLVPSTSYSIHFFIQSLSFFAAHAHTIATCFTVVPRLCHLILVSLSNSIL